MNLNPGMEGVRSGDCLVNRVSARREQPMRYAAMADRDAPPVPLRRWKCNYVTGWRAMRQLRHDRARVSACLRLERATAVYKPDS
jgi:hypothetical protein